MYERLLWFLPGGGSLTAGDADGNADAGGPDLEGCSSAAFRLFLKFTSIIRALDLSNFLLPLPLDAAGVAHSEFCSWSYWATLSRHKK